VTIIRDVSPLHSRIFLGLILAVMARSAIAQPSNRVTLKSDSSEAEAVLAILDKRALHGSVIDADWQRVFASTAYPRLQQAEASMGQPFTDEEFTRFVATLDGSREQLRQILRQWQSLDLQAAVQRSLEYLPPEANIRADVYFVIQPEINSFVFEPDTPTAAIFLKVDLKSKTREQQGNTLAHEAHHLGLATVQGAYKREISSLPEYARKAAWWMGNFREGMAVLAAAGSPDVHPHADLSEGYRLAWDLEAERFDANLNELNQFFLDTIHGNLLNQADMHEARTFFGFSGPWYTVGYRMAVTIEREFGRTALVATYVDPRRFVARYNEAAMSENAKDGSHLPVFSAEILKAVDGQNR